jgi:ADP-ribose pyrophosphatase YjhB (NUDIX family)
MRCIWLTIAVDTGTTRKFCAFAADNRGGLGMNAVPESGFCISAFLIIREAAGGKGVLMGHIDPEGPWDHIGALDPGRIEAHRHGWMLPSCHLIYGESPDACARRIAEEQLAFDGAGLSGPSIYSEVYEPRRYPGRRDHWDLEFLYFGTAGRGELHPPEHVWIDLDFVDPVAVPAGSIARSHEDIIAHLG